MDLQALDAAFSIIHTRPGRDEPASDSGRQFAAELTSALSERRLQAEARPKEPAVERAPLPPVRGDRYAKAESDKEQPPSRRDAASRTETSPGRRHDDETVEQSDRPSIDADKACEAACAANAADERPDGEAPPEGHAATDILPAPDAPTDEIAALQVAMIPVVAPPPTLPAASPSAAAIAAVEAPVTPEAQAAAPAQLALPASDAAEPQAGPTLPAAAIPAAAVPVETAQAPSAPSPVPVPEAPPVASATQAAPSPAPLAQSAPAAPLAEAAPPIADASSIQAALAAVTSPNAAVAAESAKLESAPDVVVTTSQAPVAQAIASVLVAQDLAAETNASVVPAGTSTPSPGHSTTPSAVPAEVAPSLAVASAPATAPVAPAPFSFDPASATDATDEQGSTASIDTALADSKADGALVQTTTDRRGAAEQIARAEQAQAPRQNLPLQPVADQIAIRVAKQAQTGEGRITMQLRPEALGAIDVDLQVRRDGTMKAVISVEKPETLEWLRRDAQHLERALQEVGVKTDSGSLSFNLREQRQDGFAGFARSGGQRGSGPDKGGERTEGRGSEAVTAQAAARRVARGGVDVKI